MAFEETQLLSAISKAFTGGPTFSTQKVHLRSGMVARNAERSLPLYRYSAPYDPVKDAYRDVLIAAYIACRGSSKGFRFKDWSDYQLAGEIIGTSDGSVDETMQLIKTYTFGSSSTVRNIKKPTGQAVLLQDGSPLASTTDTTTGIVTFTSTAGKVITATCEFDVPVMFEEDTLEFLFTQPQISSVHIRLIEDLMA